MGDSRRFDLFAALIERHIPKTARIADVAGGKGYLQLALRERGYKQILTWDKRPTRGMAKRSGFRRQYFTLDTKAVFDAVVAMHPDEGTDHAILYGVRNRVPVVVCPCCIKPSAAHFPHQHKYPLWLEHLKRLGRDGGMEVIHTALSPMTGKRDVLVFKPIGVN